MIFLIFFVLWCVLVSDNLALFLPPNVNIFYKSRSVLPARIKNDPNFSESITCGAQMAIDHCQKDFKWDRWNCPSSAFLRRPKQPVTKEIAYTKAIMSAGIVYSIIRSCSRGEIQGCGCDPNPESPSTITNKTSVKLKPVVPEYVLSGNREQPIDWSWGGCSDDPRFSLNVAKKLLDGLEKGRNAAGYVGRHNNKVGREIVRDTMETKCRCHGTSGSCLLQTCWMQVAPFEEISRRLKKKYNRAIKLSQEMVEKSNILGNSARAVTQEKIIPISSKCLYFLDTSPDYCFGSSAKDFSGTKGRVCSTNNSSRAEKRSCRNLCKFCGHKVKRTRREVTKECNCQFSWCCKVECQTCVETEDYYLCE